VTGLTAPPGIRLVALDIDDTLIPWRGTLSPRVIAAVQTVHAAGVEVVLATGRGIHDVAHLAAELGLDEMWALCSNGSVIVRITGGAYEIRERITFDPRGIVAALRRHDPIAPVAIESSGIGYLVDGDPYEGQAPHVAGTIGDLPHEVTFLSVASAQLDADAMLALSVGHPVRAVPYVHDGWVTVDIVHADAGKGAALAALAASLGVGPQHCAAVGDYLNDLPMLEWAGWAVAMGQAPAAVREAADAVVAASVDDGAAEALEALALAASRA